MFIEISQEMVVFIFRKILIPFSILFCIYRIHKKKGVTIDIIFSLAFMLFLIFARTYSPKYKIYYDVFDKILILIISPICFSIFSFLYFTNKSESDNKEIYKYITILLFFIIVESLYIMNIF